MSRLTEALKLAEDAFQSVQDEVSFELNETHIALFGAAATFFQYYLVPRIKREAPQMDAMEALSNGYFIGLGASLIYGNIADNIRKVRRAIEPRTTYREGKLHPTVQEFDDKLEEFAKKFSYAAMNNHEDKHLPVDELIRGEVQGQAICEPVTEAEFLNHAHMVGSRVAVKRRSGQYRGEYLGPVANTAHVKIGDIRVAVPFEDVLVY